MTRTIQLRVTLTFRKKKRPKALKSRRKTKKLQSPSRGRISQKLGAVFSNLWLRQFHWTRLIPRLRNIARITKTLRSNFANICTKCTTRLFSIINYRAICWSNGTSGCGEQRAFATTNAPSKLSVVSHDLHESFWPPRYYYFSHSFIPFQANTQCNANNKSIIV